MRPRLDDSPLFQPEDEVGTDDGVEAMRDDETRRRGRGRKRLLQGRLNGGLAERVQGASGLVEQQEARSADESAGDGDALPLTPAQQGSFLPHESGGAGRQSIDETKGVGQGQGLVNLGFGCYIRERGKRKQENELRNQS